HAPAPSPAGGGRRGWGHATKPRCPTVPPRPPPPSPAESHGQFPLAGVEFAHLKLSGCPCGRSRPPANPCHPAEPGRAPRPRARRPRRSISMIFEPIGHYGHEQVVFCHNPDVGLKAIIAIHNTVLGPALGGTRMWPYKNDAEALDDVLRLSRGMTYKNAVAGLNLGGGKA